MEADKFNIEFYLYKFDKQLYASLGGTQFNSEQELHHHLIHLASVIGINYAVQKINLIVAQRDKSFPNGCEQRWKDAFYEELIRASVQNPVMKTFFSELNVEIVNGSDPGIQIADLILWAANRKYKDNNPNNVCSIVSKKIWKHLFKYRMIRFRCMMYT